MLLLRDFGLPANYGIWAKWTSRSETCVTGMVLSILSHFKHDDDYDILRALDYFQAVNAPRDRRLAEAIGIVRSSQLLKWWDRDG